MTTTRSVSLAFALLLAGTLPAQAPMPGEPVRATPVASALPAPELPAPPPAAPWRLPAITGRLDYPAHSLVRLGVASVPPKTGTLWRVSPPTVDVATTAKELLEFTGPPGAYTVELLLISVGPDGTPTLSSLTVRVTLGGVPPGPVPPGPVPPGPVPPGPVPPGPVPPVPPGPTPIPVDGLHVMIIYETGEVQKLPPAQSAILYSKSVRDYLDAKCVVGPDAKTRQWRIWDKDVDATGESKLWQDTLKRPRTAVPWIIISTGKAGHEGPLPKSVDETLELLKKHGG